MNTIVLLVFIRIHKFYFKFLISGWMKGHLRIQTYLLINFNFKVSFEYSLSEFIIIINKMVLNRL